MARKLRLETLVSRAEKVCAAHVSAECPHPNCPDLQRALVILEAAKLIRKVAA